MRIVLALIYVTLFLASVVGLLLSATGIPAALSGYSSESEDLLLLVFWFGVSAIVIVFLLLTAKHTFSSASVSPRRPLIFTYSCLAALGILLCIAGLVSTPDFFLAPIGAILCFYSMSQLWRLRADRTAT